MFANIYNGLRTVSALSKNSPPAQKRKSLLPTLTQIDWLIVLLTLFSVLAIGLSFRSSIKTAADYFQAGRSLPTWIGVLAFLAASLGSLDLIATVAAGAQYGLRAAQFFAIGSILPLLFASLYVVPALVKSGARTLPEYLRLRFDRRTSLINAYAFGLTAIATAGFSLYLVARLFQAMHVFDALLYSFNLSHALIFPITVLLATFVVLVYVVVAGLGASIVNQAVQFLIVVAAFFPVAYTALNHIGGFAALKSALAVNLAIAGSTAHIGASSLALIAGIVLTAGYWCADFRIFQVAMAAKDAPSASRIPLFAAAGRLLVPIVLVVTGAVAISLPTPQSSTVVREENGAIYHEITVVPRDAAAGHGLVPARADADGNPVKSGNGQPQLDYDRTAPAMLMNFPPAGLLGLGIAALLAALMNSLAASATAVSAVCTFDIFRLEVPPAEEDRREITIGRLSSVAFLVLAVGAAFAFSAAKGFGFSALDALLLFFALFSAPQLATFLLGIFSRRTTANGAFAGLVAGTAAAFLHFGLALSLGLHYSSFAALCFVTAMVALLANALVTTAVSFSSSANTSEAPATLVPAKRKAKTKKPTPEPRSKQNELLAAAILLTAIALSIFFF
jgi:SSS family solute:Na+ symporter